jgi:predicted P-loop ATPase
VSAAVVTDARMSAWTSTETWLPTPEMSTVDSAARYVSRALRMAILHGILDGACTCGSATCKPGKHPYLPAWQKKVYATPDDVRDALAAKKAPQPANIGLVLGEQLDGQYLVAIDADDAARLAALESALGALPETLTSRSGGGGSHRIYCLGKGQDAARLRNRNGLRLEGEQPTPGVDVKVAGGQVVVCPSMHASGERYAWAVAAPIAALPDAWFDAVAEPLRKVRAAAPSSTRIKSHFLPSVESRARAYARRIEPSIEKVNARGGAKTFEAAQHIARGFDLDVETSLRILLDEYNHRCVPPWSEADLRRKVVEAREHGQMEIGCHRDAPMKELTVRMMNGAAKPNTSGFASGPDEEEDAPSTRVRVAPSPADVTLLEKLILDTKTDGRTGEETYAIKPTSANVATIFQHHEQWAGVIALDTFSSRIVTTRPAPWHPLDAPVEVKPGAWGDSDTARAVHWFARTSIAGLKPISVTTKIVDTAVLVAAEANAVHPVRRYLRGLVWDGTPRADSLAHRYLGGDDTPYARAVGSCFLIGAVARVMQPGCKVDTCPIIEGPQGARKSTALGTLGGEWFTDSKIPIGEKDAYQMLRGVWIAELGELAALSKSDVETTKAFMSSRVDRYRPSYGRHEVEVPRQTVFIGSTNATTYLHDATGARRFPPLRTGTIDLDALKRDRDQLWAEAVHRYDAGEPWWFSDELVEHAASETEQRFVRHPWEAVITDYVENPKRLEDGVTTEELLATCGVDTAHRTTAHSMTVGSILARLHWERRRTTVNSVRTYRYFKRSTT